MMVIDASVALEMILGLPAGLQVSQRIAERRPSLHAPHLIDLEVAQVLRRYVRNNEVSAERAKAAITDWLALPVTRYNHDRFLTRIWQLRDNVSAYDAAYVVLAEALGASLLTCDARLARTPGHHATIEFIE